MPFSRSLALTSCKDCEAPPWRARRQKLWGVCCFCSEQRSGTVKRTKMSVQNSCNPFTRREWHESTFSSKIMNIVHCAPGLYGFSGSLSVGRWFQPCLESVLMLWMKTCSQTCSMLKSYLVRTSNTLPMISSRSFWACAFWCFILECWNKILNSHPGLQPCKLPICVVITPDIFIML